MASFVTARSDWGCTTVKAAAAVLSVVVASVEAEDTITVFVAVPPFVKSEAMVAMMVTLAVASLAKVPRVQVTVWPSAEQDSEEPLALKVRPVPRVSVTSVLTALEGPLLMTLTV